MCCLRTTSEVFGFETHRKAPSPISSLARHAEQHELWPAFQKQPHEATRATVQPPWRKRRCMCLLLYGTFSIPFYSAPYKKLRHRKLIVTSNRLPRMHPLASILRHQPSAGRHFAVVRVQVRPPPLIRRFNREISCMHIINVPKELGYIPAKLKQIISIFLAGNC